MTTNWNSGADLLIKAIFIDTVFQSFSALSTRSVWNCLDKEVLQQTVSRDYPTFTEKSV